MGDKKSWGVRNVLYFGPTDVKWSPSRTPQCHATRPPMGAASGRQRTFAGRRPAGEAGVKMGRAAPWGFLFFPAAEKSKKSLKKGVDKRRTPCYNNHR